MCDRIRHRGDRHHGPNDEGFHVDGGCALGMRRLSIIDLDTGHQPLSNEDGTHPRNRPQVHLMTLAFPN